MCEGWHVPSLVCCTLTVWSPSSQVRGLGVGALCSTVDSIQWGGSLVVLITQLSKAEASATPRCLQLSLNMDPLGPWPMTLTPSSSRIPLLGQQTSEARVIRVSIDNNHGNLYRSILVRAGRG